MYIRTDLGAEREESAASVASSVSWHTEEAGGWDTPSAFGISPLAGGDGARMARAWP